jgi:hypothetical protein|nr:MAG TPA: hypothetical protein [Caudoviricetes sp.]
MLVFGTDNKGSEFSGTDLEILAICGFVSKEWHKEWLETGEVQASVDYNTILVCLELSY